MTTMTQLEPPVPTHRPRLVTGPLLLRFVSLVGSAISFYLLLSVVPLHNPSAAGIVTAALMLTSVVGELATPRLVTRYGYRRVLAAGLLLLGAPSLVLVASSAGTVVVVAVCLVRGLGFGLTVVAGGALTATLIPAERRGEGLAVVGVVGGVPGTIALPLGVWMAGHVGYSTVFIVGAVAALAAIPSVFRLPVHEPAPDRKEGVGVVAGLRTLALSLPTVVFLFTAMAAGIVVTFLPLAVTGASGGVAALALLLQPATATLARWLAGRHGDRHGAARLLVPGLVTSAAGVLLLAVTASPVAIIAGTVIFGAGFGVTQNASLTLMYARVPASGYGTVSALWNFAYDAGMGLGAAGFGAIAGLTGYSGAFVLTAGLMLTALVPALRTVSSATPRRADADAPLAAH